jgi:hypothetical protein
VESQPNDKWATVQELVGMPKLQGRLKASLARLMRWRELGPGGIIRWPEAMRDSRFDACAWEEDAQNESGKMGEGGKHPELARRMLVYHGTGEAEGLKTSG